MKLKEKDSGPVLCNLYPSEIFHFNDDMGASVYVHRIAMEMEGTVWNSESVLS